MTVATLQHALGNVSVLIGKVQGFIDLVVNGPAAASALTSVLTKRLQPTLAKVQAVADAHINPKLLAVRGVLSKAVAASSAVVRVLSNTTELGSRIDAFATYALKQADALFSKAAGSNSSGLLGKVARFFNSSQDLLDNGLKKVEVSCSRTS